MVIDELGIFSGKVRVTQIFSIDFLESNCKSWMILELSVITYIKWTHSLEIAAVINNILLHLLQDYKVSDFLNSWSRVEIDTD